MRSVKMFCFILYLACSLIFTELEAKPRIVGGLEVVDRKYFAYQVSIRYGPKHIHICGGSIIDESHVLTASHCVFAGQNIMKPQDLQVVSGDLDISIDTNATVKSDVFEIISHSDYNGRTIQNDITILKLKEPLHITSLIKPIELAFSVPPDESTCIVSGWGFTKVNGEKSKKLRFVEVPIQNREKCNSSYNNKITEGMLCAGLDEGGKDSCQYDSGGPLVCNEKLCGIISWGYGCAAEGYPGVYTDISKYISWIRSKIGQEISTMTPRIIGGIPVKNQTDFSYQVSLRYKSSHICGGTIIDNRHVLIASHCVILSDGKVISASLLQVVGGSVFLPKPKFVKNIKYVFTHSAYNLETVENDIALLRIEGTFDFSSDVKPIRLSMSPSLIDTICNVSGWGIIESNKISNNLMYTEVNILNITLCNRNYQKMLKKGMICAGFWEGKHDACQGDSGGPLVCHETLVGIVSWGYGCANKGYPGVYTDVQYYSDWIESQKQRSNSNNLIVNTILIIALFVLIFNV